MFNKLLSHHHPLRRLYHAFWGVLAAVRYGFPGKKLKVIGVTGTDGKTTTVSLITQLLTQSGFKTGMASTVAFQVGDEKWTNTSHKTTLGRFGLQKLLRRMVDAGCTHAVVEVSSHALMQYRVWGIDFSTVVWTNLTREHLDYHGTMEAYRDAKGKLFSLCVGNVRAPKRVGVVYGGCPPYTDYFRSFSLDHVVVYGEECVMEKLDQNHHEMFLSYHLHDAGELPQRFSVGTGTHTYEALLPLVGECNILNALAALGVVHEEGIPLDMLIAKLQYLEAVPGRMERVDMGQPFQVIIDYAVTPDALKSCYSMLRACTPGRLIAVLGACGDRDQGKRPEMGYIATDLCDYVFLTDEEPYGEDPQSIISMLEEGVLRHKDVHQKYEVQLSRRDAIAHALARAQEGDTVVITGMGDQTSRVVDGRGTREPWSDRDVIKEELEKIGNKKNV